MRITNNPVSPENEKEMGQWPIFCFWKMARDTRIEALFEPTLTGMGYELVGAEFVTQGKTAILRVYIDSPQGIMVEDCQRVSHQLSGILDVEDPIRGEYHLEVSSPGIERPIFKEADYERFKGKEIKVKLRELVNGRRKIKGILLGLQQDQIKIQCDDGECVEVPVMMISKANLVQTGLGGGK